MDEPALLETIHRLVPAMAERAAALDAESQFPAADIDALANAGALQAPLPRAAGGLGLGTEPAGALGLLRLLRALGEGHVALGRLYEAHVNALRLIVRYGPAELVSAAARDAAAGHLFALWVTDPPADGLTLSGDQRLIGRKQFCSGAGYVQRAVVTATDARGDIRLAVARLGPGVTVGKLSGGLLGVRAATTGEVAFDGVPAQAFGAPGDYLREPDFSCGAWRTSAVTLGGLDALVTEAVRQLRARGRTEDPHQQARIGHALIAAETARLWVHAVASCAEDAEAGPMGAVAHVNLARIAVERACLDTIELVQRSLGVAAFLRPNVLERLCRDLATYLRQPAPDLTLTAGAAHFAALDPPRLPS